MMNNPSISIVIPVYNEAKRIKTTVNKIVSFIKQREINAEIVIVNDGSQDDTAHVLIEMSGLLPNLMIINNEINQGKGSAVRKGMLSAAGNMILFTDADLSTPIEELDKFVKILKQGNDIVIASRRMRESRINIPQPLHRRVMGKLFQIIVATIIIRGIKDTQCGFKLFSREACRRIFEQQLLSGFAFDVEVLYLANRLQFKVAELPVEWNDARGSKVIPFKTSVSMLRDLLYIKLFYSLYYKRVSERYFSILRTGDING
jgi:dolichyl-phosphate beta-glucosyltransferase